VEIRTTGPLAATKSLISIHESSDRGGETDGRTVILRRMA